MTVRASRVSVRTGVDADAPACSAILDGWIDENEWMPRLYGRDSIYNFIQNVVFQERRVLVAEAEGVVVGFLAVDEEPLTTALYVIRSARCRGIGSQLLEGAKALFPSGVSLWTFQPNVGARRLYARHSFAEVRCTDGDNDENVPDVLLSWPGMEGTA